jgi:predicted alpha/beta hydrolase
MEARPVSFPAADGYPLHGFVWQHLDTEARRPVVLINPATSVRCRYYHRFATYLHGHGFDVLCYDYRGIGLSRPARLQDLEAGWLEWGQQDCEGALRHAQALGPGQPLLVVGHSVGGFLIGLAPSCAQVRRVFTMGAQFAHWRDYAPGRRLELLFKWHLVMPALTRLLGYFPGGRLGWLEDTPRGVVHDWIARHPRFEDTWQRGPRALPPEARQALAQGFGRLRGATLALSVTDDEFGTIPAIRRLLDYYTHSPRTHLHIHPSSIGVADIGHFAFFHSRFESSLWPLALSWLQDGRLLPAPAGELRHWPAEHPGINAPAASAAGC